MNPRYHIILKKKIDDKKWENYKLAVVPNKEYVAPVIKRSQHSFEAVDQWRYSDIVPETTICRHFGCGQTLTLREQLFGDFCIIHSIYGDTLK